MSVEIRIGHCVDVLHTMPERSVHTVVTSPPYYGLRSYGLAPQVWGGDPACAHEWEDRSKKGGGAYADGSKKRWQHSAEDFNRDDRFLDGHREIPAGATCSSCGAWRGGLGLEPDWRLYLDHMVAVFDEVHRVLRDDGVLWLNMGDSYATGAGAVGEHPGGGAQGARRGDARPARNGHGKEQIAPGIGPTSQPNRMPQPGLKPKDLMGMPWRLAFALQERGWWLRQDIIWSKPNPMPESVTDRCTKAHEYIFLLSKSERYFYDAEAIKETATADRPDMAKNGLRTGTAYLNQMGPADNSRKSRKIKMPDGWDTSPGGHGTFHRNGRERGKTRARGLTPRHTPYTSSCDQSGLDEVGRGEGRNKRSVWTIATAPFPNAHFATFPPALIEPCILAGCPKGGTVLDPFGGAGTTGLVADRLGRDAILIELNPDYAAMAERRIHGDAPLFADVETRAAE